MNLYGEKDGFVINGQVWWDYYKKIIDELLNKIHKNQFILGDATDFYRSFGFGPKFYIRTFSENGIDKLRSMFLYLIDDNIPVETRLHEIVEEPESNYAIKGIGINFVTLFLTSYFPKKYVQWNSQTDGALNILNAFPKKQRGEKKSSFYLKINETCLRISEILKIDFLPILDNFLFALNRGYIGNEHQIEKKFEKEVKEVVIVEENLEKSEDDSGSHAEMMYYLIKTGKNKGYDVWVAVNDRNKSYNGEQFSSLCLSEIPSFTNPQTLSIAKYVDVIWFKRNTLQPVRFFEIENSTSIYSGLLRFNDIKIDYPVQKATVVIPAARQDLFDKQIDRRSFKYSELSDICDSMTYDDLKKWYTAVAVDSKYS
jgi:type II restriction enzyme